MNTLLKLASRWKEEADLLRGYGAEEAATATEKHAREVIGAVKRAEDEALTLTEAAAESGFSKRRLRELVSLGEIPNMGRKGAPRIRRADLPRKAKVASNGFDPGAEARFIVGAGG